MLTLLCAYALAADEPELIVVGLHVPARTGALPMEDAKRLAAVLDDTGKVDALAPDEVSARIAGRERLILDTFALGPGREKMKEGKILYDRAQPDEAVPVLEDAARLLAAGLAQSPDASDLHASLMLLGMAHVGMGDTAAAKEAFRRSATLDPTRQLDAVNYPPQVIELFDGVRREVAQVSPGHLQVTASMDAHVWMDGREVGPTPQNDIALVAGEHFVLVRAESGASQFTTVTLGSGEKRPIDAMLESRFVGRAVDEASGRSRQTRELYRSLGTYTDKAVIVLGGVTATGQVALQLYSPASGNFSRVLTGEAGDDPVGAILDLAPAVVGYLNEHGDLRADRVSPQVLSLDVGANDVLAGMLFDPPSAEARIVQVSKGPKWYVWAGVGALVAGGAATGAILLTSGDDPGGTDPDPEPSPDQGTIVFGPIP